MTSDYQALVQGTTSLQNYWNFEDLGTTGNFTTVQDLTSGKNATAIGTVESQAGLVGYSGYFAGDTDSGTINNVLEVLGSDTDTTFDLSGGSFTLEALVRTDTLPANSWSGIVSKGDSAWRIARQSSSSGIQSAASGLAGVTNGFHTLDNDIWHYVALRYDSTSNVVTSIFDDVSVSTTVGAEDLLSTNAFTVMIGGNAEKPEREWQGYIDEVALYTAALTDNEIANRVTLLDSDPSAIDAVAMAYWTGAQATGSFDNASGWDFNAPQDGDAVVIGKSGTVDFNSGSVALSSLEVGTTEDLLGNDSDGPGQLNIHDGYLRINSGDDTTLGRGAGNLGVINQSGGTLHVRGDDYQFGLDADGAEGRHTMTGGVLLVGDWAEDNQFSGGWFMTNDSGAGDDLSLGRYRSVSDGTPTGASTGVLDMSGDSATRVSNDVFLDSGIGELYMTDNAVMHVGDDFRASSADYGESLIEMSGSSNLKVEGRLSIADSLFSTSELNLSGNSLVEVGMYLAVGGQDNLNESGDGVVNVEGNATINIGAFLYRGDVGGNVGDTVVADRVADEQELYVGAGNDGVGSGTVNQTGAGSLVSVGRHAYIGQEAVGVYNLRGGRFETRGDAPISGVDFTAGLDDDSQYTSGGGDVFIGSETTGVGTLNVEGGELDIARDFIVGLDGSGRFRVQGDDSTIDVGGDFSFGGNYAGAAEGSGVLEIAVDGMSQSVININGGADDGLGGSVPGDLLIWSGALEPSFTGGYSPAVGDYTSNPLEWLIIDYAGTRDGEFTLAAGLVDGSENGTKWGVRYDDVAGQVYLQALEVLVAAPSSPGDFNGDGVVNLADYTVWRNNLGGDAAALLGNGAGGTTVTSADYDLWKTHFGTDYNSSAATSPQQVPEPTALWLCGVAVLATGIGRRYGRAN